MLLQQQLDGDKPEQKDSCAPLLQVRNLKKYFPITSPFGRLKGHVKAVESVNFDLYEKGTLGLVGESGCGKSTTGRSILRLIEPTEGSVNYRGKELLQLNQSEFKGFRKDMQMVFQDPHSSLNPKKRIGELIEEPMEIHKIGTKAERMERAMDLLKRTGIREDQYFRFPHEFSGGQRQRIGIARALAVDPSIIVLDEPVSALDVSIQSQVLNLLEEIQDEFKLAYLFISHDLSVVRHTADEIGVMYLGHMVEKAPTDDLFANPLHPYTKALLSAIPIPDRKQRRERIIIKGDVPSPIDPPTGCVFHTRCPFVMDQCKTIKPEMLQQSDGHQVACHLYN
ncbi:ABC transporter ATP-binding protein [Bhargavaea beijingensis]|uniref:Dipeptide ABC transporter ATP-binding protein n=1 Tax=Bhargavaea beijingensis TaxID=426756 RepID=A0A1G6Z4Q7_9BACL|nr:dipeptide ABC transporter ATP-binding protein [Bhargavaea beijingensis]MCW1929278.1 dipeptide ABC transporter ATP-binding protein [Bhargavaea beijingensis]RSK36508.1 dipeptide ABC transporter ATP-binding protein [Bhargavaea beijingensis]SDD97472.1 peptide/nickel transport system ATP-binding protein [Bhargavaea beijingensis]